jgi:NAD(P)-dependent dehydrogenase (short-subunit alcohol dehydrogenase family)
MSNASIDRRAANILDFHGRVAMIVGAGPGLGTTLARRFAAAGADVALVARSEASLKSSAAAAVDAGAEPLSIAADITVPDEAERAADAVISRWGRVDVLINAAFGASRKQNVVDMDRADLEAWRKNVEIGGFGTLLTCRYVAPYMIERGAGAIVNVTSMSSRIGFGGRSDYSAGKIQAHRIAHALADELGPHGIRVNCVAPGHIDSERLRRFYEEQAARQGIAPQAVADRYTSEMALRRLVTEDEVANAVLFLSSDLASGITGAILDVNAGHLFAP